MFARWAILLVVACRLQKFVETRFHLTPLTERNVVLIACNRIPRPAVALCLTAAGLSTTREVPLEQLENFPCNGMRIAKFKSRGTLRYSW